MTLQTTDTIAVIGAGIMGAGIAQVAAQSGHTVLLYDARENAAQEGKDKLASSLQKLVERGKFTADSVAAILDNIKPVATLQDLAPARMVIEAIVENLDIKRKLFGDLQEIVADDCILASNTSSISITAIANGIKNPQRVLGVHFFNPAPIMKLVEIVSGLQTDPKLAQLAYDTVKGWGKSVVHARSTPGFIVNRIARPFYAETLTLLQENVGTPAQFDACLRAAGFRMGPCELTDLIGHDTNFAVTESVYHANFSDKRFQPSLVQRDLVDGGLLGRKSGQGFYDYNNSTASNKQDSTAAPALSLPSAGSLVLHGQGAFIERWAKSLQAADQQVERKPDSNWCGLQVGAAQLRQSDGRPATQVALEESVRNVSVYDVTGLIHPDMQEQASLAWSCSESSDDDWQKDSAQWLQAAGVTPVQIGDTAGLVVARTIAMLVNEAADAVQQDVCSQEDADMAMKLGVNYPAGPFEWLQRWGATDVVHVLDELDAFYCGERYRSSPLLQRQAWVENMQD